LHLERATEELEMEMDWSVPIMVPLDGSRLAEQALGAAIDLCGSKRRLHVVQVHVPGSLATTPRELDLCGALRAHEESYLREMAARCDAAGLTVRTALLDGPAAAALTTYVQEHGIGLIVMTSHGAGGVNRAWLGSVADAVLRRVRVPVLLLRPDGRCAQACGALQHVVVPVDGSELSASVLEPATRVAGPAARLTLLHVLSTPTRPEADGPALQEARDDAELILDELAAPLRARGRRVDVAIISSDHPALAILGYAAAEGADAIALATRGQGGGARRSTGRVADKVIRASQLPLLLYRPPPLECASDAIETDVEAEGAGVLRALALRAG
jgi:nucleotide-binding universal stress UspA family protein